MRNHRMWGFIALMIMVSSLVPLLALVDARQARAQSSQEQQVLALINDYRQSNGLQPLTTSGALSTAAVRHSEDMATYGFFSHTSEVSSYYPVGSDHSARVQQEGYTYDTYTGENLAYGQEGAQAVFEAWKASPEHNAIMLSPDYNAIGIGLAYNDGGVPFWSAEFGGVAAGGTGSQSPQPEQEQPAPQPQPTASEQQYQEPAQPAAVQQYEEPAAAQQYDGAQEDQYDQEPAATEDQYEQEPQAPRGTQQAAEPASPETVEEPEAQVDGSPKASPKQQQGKVVTDIDPQGSSISASVSAPADAETAVAGQYAEGNSASASGSIDVLPDTGGVHVAWVAVVLGLAAATVRRLFSV